MTTQGFQLTREFFEGEVATLTAIVEQVKVKQGSASQRAKDATLTALGGDVTFTADDDLSALAGVFSLVADDDGDTHVINLGDLATAVHNLNEWAAQIGNEAVTAILKAQGDDKSLATLKEQYTAQKEKVEALQTVFKLVPDVDVSDIELPTLRAARVSASPAPSRKGKRGTFYRIIDGERRPQSSRQDSMSSMAWYYGAVICERDGNGSSNNGHGVSAAELEAYLRKNVTDSPFGKAWTVERMIGDKVVTYGMDVVGGDEEE